MLHTQRTEVTAPAVAAIDLAIKEAAKVVLGVSGSNNLVLVNGINIDLFVNRERKHLDEMDVDHIALCDLIRARVTISGITSFHF